MTENTRPEQPAPQPHANWPQPGQGNYPSHGSNGPTPGNEPPYGPPQQYTPPGYGQQQQYAQPPQPQQQYGQPQYAPYPPQQYAPAQWAPAAPFKPKASGFRVAAGIVGIVLGLCLLIASVDAIGYYGDTILIGILLLIAALGNVTAGILLLAFQRGHSQGAPITSLSFALLALLLGFISLAVPFFGAKLFVITLILSAPILIVMGLGVAKERRAARRR